MKKINVLIVTILFSCTNYDSEKYLTEENKAINDLIPMMTDIQDLLRMNDYGKLKPILKVINQLENNLSLFGNQNYTIEDKNNLRPLIKMEIKERIVNQEIFKTFEEIEIKVINKEDFKLDYKNTDNLFGYLILSRIIFKNNFTRGYLSYACFCGEGCALDSIIEIEKINNKWLLKRRITFGIT